MINFFEYAKGAVIAPRLSDLLDNLDPEVDRASDALARLLRAFPPQAPEVAIEYSVEYSYLERTPPRPGTPSRQTPPDPRAVPQPAGPRPAPADERRSHQPQRPRPGEQAQPAPNRQVRPK